MSRWSLLDRNVPKDSEQAAAPTVVVDPAFTIIDEALTAFAGRTLIAGDEVLDRLLDLRSALAAAMVLNELETSPTTAG
jgi:hypothetical protein